MVVLKSTAVVQFESAVDPESRRQRMTVGASRALRQGAGGESGGVMNASTLISISGTPATALGATENAWILGTPASRYGVRAPLRSGLTQDPSCTSAKCTCPQVGSTHPISEWRRTK